LKSEVTRLEKMVAARDAEIRALLEEKELLDRINDLREQLGIQPA
jgi:hypothetical protein